MSAFIKIRLSHNRLPGRRIVLAADHILDVDISSRSVNRHRIVTVSCQSSFSGIPIKKKSTAIIGNKASERAKAKIIYPRSRCIRPCYNIFLFIYIKITVLFSWFQNIIAQDAVLPINHFLSIPLLSFEFLHFKKAYIFCRLHLFGCYKHFIKLNAQKDFD